VDTIFKGCGRGWTGIRLVYWSALHASARRGRCKRDRLVDVGLDIDFPVVVARLDVREDAVAIDPGIERDLEIERLMGLEALEDLDTFFLKILDLAVDAASTVLCARLFHLSLEGRDFVDDGLDLLVSLVLVGGDMSRREFEGRVFVRDSLDLPSGGYRRVLAGHEARDGHAASVFAGGAQDGLNRRELGLFWSERELDMGCLVCVFKLFCACMEQFLLGLP